MSELTIAIILGIIAWWIESAARNAVASLTLIRLLKIGDYVYHNGADYQVIHVGWYRTKMKELDTGLPARFTNEELTHPYPISYAGSKSYFVEIDDLLIAGEPQPSEKGGLTWTHDIYDVLLDQDWFYMGIDPRVRIREATGDAIRYAVAVPVLSPPQEIQEAEKLKKPLTQPTMRADWEARLRECLIAGLTDKGIEIGDRSDVDLVWKNK